MSVAAGEPRTEAAAEVEVPSAPGRRATVASLLAATLIPLGSTMLAVAIPSIADALGTSGAVLTPWLVTSYLAVSILGQGPGGRLADRVGHGRALALGQAACALGAVAGAIAPATWVLVAARVLMAAGGAVMIPAAMALLRSVTPPERRAHAFGTFGSVMGLAAALGPVAGGEITGAFGWRATFVLQLVPLAASALLLPRGRGALAPDRPDTVRARPARGGTALRALLRERAFVGGAVAVALLNCAMYATLFQMPLLLHDVLGMPAEVVGRALLAMTGAMVAGSWLGGPVSTALGPRATVVAASLTATAGLLLLADVAALRAVADALPGLALLGLGVGLTNGPAQASAMSVVGPRGSGLAAGVLSSLRYLGGAAGMLVLLPLHGAEGAGLLAAHGHAVAALVVAAALAAPVALLLPSRAARA